MEICRLCLSTNVQLLVKDIERKELYLKIKDCVNIEINNTDNLPKGICMGCIKSVDDWFDFREMCIRSNKKLRSHEGILNVNVKLEKEKIEDDQNEMPVSDFENIDDLCFEVKEEPKIDKCINDEREEKCSQVKHKCEICSKEFEGVLEYLDHQNGHNGELVFNCDKCKEIFKNKLDLVNHEKSHKYPCPICGKMILKTSVKLHLVKHTDRYVCSKCSSRFHCKTTLSQHITAVHTDRKDYICETCSKRFSLKSAMIVHQKTHKEEREYTCKLCKYAGRTASAVYIHMATHANETHCCEICPKTFKSLRNLKDHLKRVHSKEKEKKYHCTYCDKKFLQNYLLKIHIRTHTGHRPYLCTQCDKAFVRSDSLKEHMVTHGSRTLYNCKQCKKVFTSKRGHKRHNCKL